ncbi:MAG: hypothetical protein EOM40_13815 [Clostridia bacterium]|nr:hypothetical protein [Clostridia bacterium]NCC42373.1 hypothetical protein [Clostridia bacterium]
MISSELGHLQHIYAIAALLVLTQGRRRILLVFAPQITGTVCSMLSNTIHDVHKLQKAQFDAVFLGILNAARSKHLAE